MSKQHHLGTDHIHVVPDKSLLPALIIDSGDIVRFRTLDACWGEVRSVADFMRYRKHNVRGSNPLTGPVFVRAAAPGSTLQVEVFQIELDATGFQLIGPQRALIRDEVSDWKCHLVNIQGQDVILSNGLKLRADPVIGHMGNAPAGEATPKACACGGNFDCPSIRQGSAVYLPIEVAGALFSIGDVHACQGDGEIVGAPEIGATVTLRLSVVPGKYSGWPLVEDPEFWHTLGSGDSEAEAIRVAVFEAARLVEKQASLTFDDAMVLLTMTAKIHCCRTGLWGSHGPVASVSIKKEHITRNRG